MNEHQQRIIELENDKKWLQEQIDALELELENLRNENKKLKESNSDASWAHENSRSYYDNGRDGWL